MLLTRLLAREPALVGEPTLGWDVLIAGYTLRGLRVRLDAPAASMCSGATTSREASSSSMARAPWMLTGARR